MSELFVISLKRSAKTYASFSDAEKVARRQVWRGTGGIYLRTSDNIIEELATLRRDSYGKLWVDLTWEGSRYA
jgi:hypothetical protein